VIKMPLAKKVVLEWFYPRGGGTKLAKKYKWGCPVCHLVYEKQTDAQACCRDKKKAPYWLTFDPQNPSVGTYDKEGYHENL